MPFQQLYERPDGSRVKIEPILRIEAFDNKAFQWSHIVYRAAPGQETFEDVTDQQLQGQAYVTEREIRECQLMIWQMLRPAM